LCASPPSPRTHARRLTRAQEELGVPYTIKPWQRTAEGLAPPKLKDIHPLGRAPIIEDNGLVIAESGAIVGESAMTSLAGER
jgi:glutathione S-transferase